MKKLLLFIIFIIALLYSPLTDLKKAEATIALPIRVPVLAIAYFPKNAESPNYLDETETGWGGNNWGSLTVADWEDRAGRMLADGLSIVSESTKYHGYKDSSAPQYLNYTLIAPLKKYYAPIPRGYVLNADTNTYRPNYKKILSDLSICNYVDQQGVKEVWLYGYHSRLIVPDESRMSSKYGDISNSYPKEQFIPEELRLPICQNSYVLYNFTYQPGIGPPSNTIHNRLHQIENVIAFAEGPDRYPANFQNTPGSTFWGDFSEYPSSNTKRTDYRSSCGNTHLAPNWSDVNLDGYNYYSSAKADFNCETWHPDDSKTIYINAGCERWSCTDVGFYKWFMQNMPGYNNGIVYQGKKMRNWWEAMRDFNAFIDSGRSLYEDITLSPTITPTTYNLKPSSTPTPTPTTHNPSPTTFLTPTPARFVLPTIARSRINIVFPTLALPTWAPQPTNRPIPTINFSPRLPRPTWTFPRR